MQENKILKWSLILSIVIVANLFFNYSLSVIFNAPKYDEICSFEKTSMQIPDKTTCEQEGGIWELTPRPGSTTKEDLTGICNMYTKCSNEFQKLNQAYAQKVFIVLVVIGVIVLTASFVLKSNPVISSALALTAVLDLIVATIRYWEYSNELLKVLILFIALVALFYLAIKKFNTKI